MPIVIKKDDYELKKSGNSYYCYNSLYLGKVKHLVLQAAFEAIYPDPKSFHIPIIAKFTPNEGSDIITIDKHLNITNSHDIEYIMAREHLRMWRLSYLLMNILVIIGSAILIAIMSIIYFLTSNYNIILGIATIILALYFIILIIKLIRQLIISNSKRVRLVDLSEIEEVIK